MTAPADEVMRRSARLARMKQAGVHDPIRFVRSERETRAAIAHQLKRRRLPAPTIPNGNGGTSPDPFRFCGWCGERRPCDEHDHLEQAWRQEHGMPAADGILNGHGK